MNFILNRDKTVVSLSGRSVEFVKGQPTYVPPQVHAEVMAIGALPEEEMPEDDENKKPVELTPDERKLLIKQAMEDMVAGNKREDFTAAGTPNLKALSTRVGFAVDKRESDPIWAEMHKVGD